MKGLPLNIRMDIRKAGIGVAAALLLASAALGFMILFPSGKDYRSRALDEGQRIEFSLSTGEVTGKLATKDEWVAIKAEEKAAKAAAEHAPATEEHAAEEQTQDAAHVSEEQPTEHADAPAEEATHEEAATPPAEATGTETAAEQPPALPVPVPPLAPVERQLASGQIVPVISNNQIPVRYFSQPAPTLPKGTVGKIALAVSGLGFSERVTEAAVALPQAVTLSFSPYGKRSAEWALAARSAGHELLLDLPAQTRRYPAVDPGPYGLLADQSKEAADGRFINALASIRGYIGVMTPYEDSLSQHEDAITSTLARLRAQGLMMVNTYTQPTEAMFDVSRKSGVPILHVNIILDRDLDETSIRNQLARVEDLARQYDKLLVVTRASPLVITLLDEWLRTLGQKKMVIIPVSSLLPEPTPEELAPVDAPPAPGSDAAAALKAKEEAKKPAEEHEEKAN